MKKNLFYLFGLVLLSFSIASCDNDEEVVQAEQEQVSQDSTFNIFKDSFIVALWEIYPAWASGVGYHKYDSIISIPDDADRMKQLVFAEDYLDSLELFSLKKLDKHNQMDYHLIKNQLESIQWYINKFKQYEWDPSYYNVGNGIGEIMNGNYAPREERMEALYKRLTFVPQMYAAGKANIKVPTKEHTELGITQNKGTLNLLRSLKDSVGTLELKADKKVVFNQRIDSAIVAVKSYVKYLEKLVAPASADSFRNFRIGKDLYADKFKYDLQARYSAEEIFQIAQREKEDAQAEMLRLTHRLWPKYFGTKKDSVNLQDVKQLIGKISEKHVKRDDFVNAIKKQLPELQKFVEENDLLFLDPEKPLQVRVTPEYMRGIAGASISSPGPYDKYEPTYYNVTPLDDYSPEQAESYLREYNYYTLQILNIHEAIPGHYAQLVYSNESPSIIKSILGNTTMIEGWACFAERMMLEAGYGNNEDELWLMYYKWYLRIICNTILDYSVHTKGMTKDEAMDLLMNQAFQERTEAEGKWRRVTLTSVQLDSYFTGLTEILNLRDEMKKKLGEQFNIKEFNEKFLSYGSAPVKYIRELMLEEYGLKIDNTDSLKTEKL